MRSQTTETEERQVAETSTSSSSGQHEDSNLTYSHIITVDELRNKAPVIYSTQNSMFKLFAAKDYKEVGEGGCRQIFNDYMRNCLHNGQKLITAENVKQYHTEKEQREFLYQKWKTL